MEEFRCPRCNKLFFKYGLKGDLKVEILCRGCKQIATLIIKDEKAGINKGMVGM